MSKQAQDAEAGTIGERPEDLIDAAFRSKDHHIRQGEYSKNRGRLSREGIPWMLPSRFTRPVGRGDAEFTGVGRIL